MTTFAGASFLGFAPMQGALNPTLSLAGLRFDRSVGMSTADTIAGEDDPIFAKRDSIISTEPDLAIAGERTEHGGETLFNRVIVNPRSKDFGFVLTQQQVTIDVWSTFTDVPQTMNALSIAGDGGLSIANPYGVPVVFWPLQARAYVATMPQNGAPVINQVATWDFGSAIQGTTFAAKGSRITVFSIAPNWDKGIRETFSYLTEVLAAYSDKEQRRQLRRSPRRGMKYSILTQDARTAALLDSLLWGWQHQSFGVPYWPDATPLSSDIAAGAFTIPIPTANKLFNVGGLACIWTDAFTLDALAIIAMDANSITFSSPLANSYKAGARTLVFPLFLARLGDSIELSRYCSIGDEMELDFDGEAQQVAATFSGSWTQYQGIDVLEVAPNWRDNLKRKYNRSMIVLDSKSGTKCVDDKGGSPVVGTELPWFMGTHVAANTFRAFLDKRKGKLVPFWMPTWDQDLVLAANTLATDTSILVQDVQYTRFFFPNKARRYLAFIRAGQAAIYKLVTGSGSNGNGTETLTLDSAIGAVLDKNTTCVSFLTLVRLDTDDVELNWNTTENAEAVLSTSETPREVP